VLGVFGLLGLALAAIGIYGVMSYSVSLQTREIGLRMALGAETRDVIKLILMQGMGLTLIGTIIGLMLAVAVTRLLTSLLYGVTATDPATFVRSLGVPPLSYFLNLRFIVGPAPRMFRLRVELQLFSSQLPGASPLLFTKLVATTNSGEIVSFPTIEHRQPISGPPQREFESKNRSVRNRARCYRHLRDGNFSGGTRMNISAKDALSSVDKIISPTPSPARSIVDPPKSIAKRVGAIDWEQVSRELDEQGNAMLERLLSPDECQVLASLYTKDDVFRSQVVMTRHGFGRGEYKYFSYPLPRLIERFRATVYPHLVPIANRWNEEMGFAVRYQERHSDFIDRCHQAGQIKPTPLLLKYEANDYNCLHQDLYGEHVFPLQLAILLSEPHRDFTGGEFVMTEQRPRMQSRPMVVPLRQGDGVVFAVHNRPVRGKRGVYRVNLRHGVSRIRSGHRYTLGIIFHDAQ